MNDNEKKQDGEQTVLPGFETEELTADAVKRGMAQTQFFMDFARDPEDAFFKWKIPAGSYERWYGNHFKRLVHEVAKQTGADPEQIANKDTRTEEQQQLLLEAATKMTVYRIERFYNSLYMDAINHLEPLTGVYNDPGEIDFYTDDNRFNPDNEYISIKEQAVQYFFATHSTMDPSAEEQLTTAQAEELIDIYNRLDAFYQEYTGGEPYGKTPKVLFAFIEQEHPETAETIAAELAFVQGIKPKSHTMPNNALMNALQQKPAINAGPFDLIVSGEKGKRKEITAYTMIEFDPGETNITITDAKLSEYERQVSDALVSLWIEADKEKLPPVFTPDMIYRAMPGGSDKASRGQKSAITKTIEKFRRLHITVDATEEMRKRGIIADNATCKLDNFYLSATHAEYKVKNGGQTVNAYKIDTEPIILTYCNMTRQLLTIPAKYIAIEKVKKGKASGELLPMTADRQAMTGYILRRIAVMKRDRKNKVQTQSNIIRFDTLFADAGIAEQTRDKAMDNRKFCFQVLDYQVAVGNIKGYVQQTTGRSISGVEILF